MVDNNKKEIQEMMLVSEEINSINLKVNQLMKDLDSSQKVLGTVKDLTAKLTERVKSLSDKTNKFKPEVTQSGKQGTPSHEDGVNERERVVPGPGPKTDIKVEKIVRKVNDEVPLIKHHRLEPDNKVVDEKINKIKRDSSKRAFKKFKQG